VGRLFADAFAGVRAAVRARFGTFLMAAVAVVVLSVLVPAVLLSLVRKPVDFFTFNPWLRRLPEYLASPEHPFSTKVEKLSNLALFWFSADSPYGGTDWGFAVDVRDVARIVVTALLVGLYFALWRERRATAGGCALPAARLGAGAGRAGGIAGAFVGVIGLSTGPCSVVGCGAPVLPVVGLAFAGFSSGTLTLLAGVGSVATTAVLAVLVVAVAYLSSRVGAARRRGRAGPVEASVERAPAGRPGCPGPGPSVGEFEGPFRGPS
jgi:hypothetical protein